MVKVLCMLLFDSLQFLIIKNLYSVYSTIRFGFRYSYYSFTYIQINYKFD